MIKLKHILCGLYSLVSCLTFGQQSDNFLASELKFSVITCSPGHEIYSTFGHTAFRVQGEMNGKKIDWIYNYGTFEYGDDFEMKFARGKLNYTLSKENFPNFKFNYIQEARGIKEQVLALSPEQKDRLIHFLEWNCKKENREYLYDFFYNNCSTKVRDILMEICGDELIFDDLSDGKTTFRYRIDEYLKEFPWTDLGIDLALGMPCDKIMKPGDEMFLPDFLYLNIQKAQLNGQSLVLEENTIVLPGEKDSLTSINAPVLLFWVLALLVSLCMYQFFQKGKKNDVLSTSIYILIGLIGVLIFLLWFATDHLATQSNLNLLWAVPFCLLFPLIIKKDHFFKRVLLIYSGFLILSLIVDLFSIQNIHSAVLPVVIMVLSCNLKNYLLR